MGFYEWYGMILLIGMIGRVVFLNNEVKTIKVRLDELEKTKPSVVD